MSDSKLVQILLYSPNNIKDQVIEYLKYNPKEIKQIIELSFGSKQPEGWRSAWVLSEYIKIDNNVVQNKQALVKKIIENLEKFNSKGQVREFLKVLLIYNVPEKYIGKLISMCFDWLLQADADKSFKVHAMQIIYNYSKKEPDLLIELKLILEELITHESAGVINRAKKILNKI